MQTILLGFLFGTTSTMVLWAAGSAAVMRDQMMTRLDRALSPSEGV
jgi:type III secretory pathway component EscT